MLHIYSIAVRPDKNDMAIEPEGMDRKERVSKEGGGKFCKWNRFWTSNSNLSHSSAYSPFLQPPRTPLVPPTICPTAGSSFLYYFHPPDKITHFLPSYLFAWSYRTLPLWQIVILQPLASHTPFFSPPRHPFSSSGSIPLTVQSSSTLVRHRWVFVWLDSDCGQIYIDIVCIHLRTFAVWCFWRTASSIPAASEPPRLDSGNESHHGQRMAELRHLYRKDKADVPYCKHGNLTTKTSSSSSQSSWGLDVEMLYFCGVARNIHSYLTSESSVSWFRSFGSCLQALRVSWVEAVLYKNKRLCFHLCARKKKAELNQISFQFWYSPFSASAE